MRVATPCEEVHPTDLIFLSFSSKKYSWVIQAVICAWRIFYFTNLILLKPPVHTVVSTGDEDMIALRSLKGQGPVWIVCGNRFAIHFDIDLFIWVPVGSLLFSENFWKVTAKSNIRITYYVVITLIKLLYSMHCSLFNVIRFGVCYDSHWLSRNNVIIIRANGENPEPQNELWNDY